MNVKLSVWFYGLYVRKGQLCTRLSSLMMKSGSLRGSRICFHGSRWVFLSQLIFRVEEGRWQYIESHHVDVVVSDIEMPDLSGIELCERISGMPVRIVFISSYQNYEYFRSAIRYKVEDYLLKPIRFQELSECFSKIREELDEENHVSAEAPVAYYDQIVREVKNYIEQHYQDASQNEAAALVGMSSGYLSRIFKEKSGKGFMEYLTEVRMKKACELLDNIQFKSYDVAYYVGYDNPKNFSRAFKAYLGMTPKEYRSHKGING